MLGARTIPEEELSGEEVVQVSMLELVKAKHKDLPFVRDLCDQAPDQALGLLSVEEIEVAAGQWAEQNGKSFVRLEDTDFHTRTLTIRVIPKRDVSAILEEYGVSKLFQPH